MSNNRNLHTLPLRQQGAVLAVSLIILLLMTLLGVSAMQTTTLEEKMAGNSRDGNLAFQAAEGALKNAELDLSGLNPPPTNGSGTNGYYDALDNSLWQAMPCLGGATNVQTYNGDTIAYVASQPEYFIEKMPVSIAVEGEELSVDVPVSDADYYRATACGIGGTPTAITILQIIYRR